MQYLFISFIAGVLTVLAPCVFTLLPVVLGGTISGNTWKKPAVIIFSLVISIFVFTLALKASTLLINIDPKFWNFISGGILLVFGIFTLFPGLWDYINIKLGLSFNSDKLMLFGSKQKGLIGDILIGAALGPIFSSCSPTYAIIIATILPQDFLTGVVNLVFYLTGLALILAVISIFGQRIIKKTKWAANPKGMFKKILGIVFIVIGAAIILGLDKKFETYLLDQGLFDVTRIEIQLLNNNKTPTKPLPTISNIKLNQTNPYPAPEITGISDWVNSEPLTLKSLKGKVVLIDFWTYSCINCIRTLPYLTEWYNKYKNDGLVIIGMHSPEFSFEKVKANVQNAVLANKIDYPVALDNNFSTWKAYENSYWPAGYFINKDGNVVHTHFGEGDYTENENVIRYLLGLNELPDSLTGTVTPEYNRMQTPETYLGYSRIENFANIKQFKADTTVSYIQQVVNNNSWGLAGDWIILPEYIICKSEKCTLTLNFNAKQVYLVMGASSNTIAEAKVFDGDTLASTESINVKNYGLYTVAKLPSFKTNQKLEITVTDGMQLNAFTFGS